MHAVPHLVGCERASDFFGDFFARRNLDERKSAGRTLQPIEMLLELENPALINSQSFPDGVAALNDGIEWADTSLLAMHQLTVDVYDQIAVSFVEFLQHEEAKLN